MTDQPIIYPTLSGMRYGYWTGAGYSAGGESPSFVPYTRDQADERHLDAFDFASKRHDLEYNDAQQGLLTALISGTDRIEALGYGDGVDGPCSPASQCATVVVGN